MLMLCNILFDDYVFCPIYTECLGKIIIQLMELEFSGVINVGSPLACSKFDFGIQLAEEFGFDHELIKKGSIAGHDFDASRPNNLILNTQKLDDLGITAPDYEISIKKFKENQPGI